MNTERTASPADASVDEARLRELISCLMDGELGEQTAGDRQRCLERLCADERARSDWAVWHLCSDALRSSEVAALHASTFSVRVSAALANEPAIVAPRALSRSTDQQHRMIRRVMLPGAAAVAAVAMLTVVALPMLRGTDGSTPVEVAGVGGASQPSGTLIRTVPVSAAVVRDLPASMVQRSSTMDPSRFDIYLSAHSQMSGSLGLPRTSPYLRQSGAVDPATRGRLLRAEDSTGGR
jgi:sigma-E factor negative regulatory protein RseA